MSIEQAMKKILPNRGTDLEHFISAFATDLMLEQRIAYVASGNGLGQAEYIGLSLPGTDAADAKWMIKKLTYDSSNRVTLIQFADDVAEFSKIWDSRTSYFS